MIDSLYTPDISLLLFFASQVLVCLLGLLVVLLHGNLKLLNRVAEWCYIRLILRIVRLPNTIFLIISGYSWPEERLLLGMEDTETKPLLSEGDQRRGTMMDRHRGAWHVLVYTYSPLLLIQYIFPVVGPAEHRRSQT